jgi:predicted secreted hydrolase
LVYFQKTQKAYSSLIILSIILFIFSPLKIFAQDFKRALPGRIFSFPKDHFSHPEFKTEWWYYSGHLQADKRPFGYQLTFFRTGLRGETKSQGSKWAVQNLYFAHLALTDESKKRFDYREKISRGSLGEAGAFSYKKEGELFRVWIEDWSAEGQGPGMRNHFLKAGDKDLGMELLLTPEKSPIAHGLNGVSQKAKEEGYGSHYYSISRLKAEGEVFLRGKELPVQGISWMDHEFGSGQLRDDQVGWDWFSLQLDNRMELMLYQIRNQNEEIHPYSSGTMIFTDSTHLYLPSEAFQIEVLERWRSKKSGSTYPSKWRVRVPHSQIDLLLIPTVKDQELITKESTRVTYWEGSVRIEGKYQGNLVKGLGYVELTGYAKPLSGKI